MTMRTASTPLGADFNRTFELLLAADEALQQRAAAIRRELFADRLSDHPAKVDDTQGVDCLLRHRPSGLDAGCVRLVFPDAGGGGLPFERYGLRYIDRSRFDWKQLDAQHCCEISQLAVSAQFRRRPGEYDSAAGVADGDDTDRFTRRRFPFIAVVLYHASIVLVLQRGYRHVFMTIEPRLQRHLQRHGITVRQISAVFEGEGQRAVYMTTAEQLKIEMSGWSPELKGLYSIVHTQLLGRSPRIAAVHKPKPQH